MLRQWQKRGAEVVLVCDGEKGRLAARELGIRAEDAESPKFNRLWVPGADIEPVPNVAGVVGYLGRAGEATQAWMASARRMFPGAAITHRSERPSRAKALRFPLPPLRPSANGPVVIHIGAGNPGKAWPVARWLELARLLPESPPAVLIAGEVERDRLSREDRSAFVGAGGRFLNSLGDLADTLKSSRLAIAADSGPGHLAAQLGVPTLSLFGPTDPARWSPVGPAVQVLAPPAPRPMDWLDVPAVLAAARALLA